MSDIRTLDGRLIDVQQWTPEPTIEVTGFSLCASCHDDEVAEHGQLCADCGGPDPSVQILVRTLIRKLRTAVASVLSCPECSSRDPKGTMRCMNCNFHSGAAYALGTVIEQLGKQELAAPYMALIFVPR